MTLEEHHKKIQAAIDAAKDDGYNVVINTCCCSDVRVSVESNSGESRDLVVEVW